MPHPALRQPLPVRSGAAIQLPAINNKIALKPAHNVLSKAEQTNGFDRLIARASKATRQILNKVLRVAKSLARA